jgi:hypothetical protein
MRLIKSIYIVGEIGFALVVISDSRGKWNIII